MANPNAIAPLIQPEHVIIPFVELSKLKLLTFRNSIKKLIPYTTAILPPIKKINSQVKKEKEKAIAGLTESPKNTKTYPSPKLDITFDTTALSSLA